MRNVFYFVLGSILLLSSSALAINGRTTYQAKIYKPDGLPLEAVSVNFRFTVLDPSASCVLYVEDYAAVNMIGSGGLTSFSLGMGTRTYPASGPVTFAAVFDNSTPSFVCQAPGVYNPVPTDNRKVVMQFNEGTGWQTLPAMAINSVPYAMYAAKAQNSQQLNGKADTAFVEYSTLASLNCQADEAIKFNGVSFACIQVGVGSSGITSVTTSGTVLSTGGTASAPVISIQAATMAQDGYLTSADYAEFKAKLSASATQIISTLGYTPADNAASGTYAQKANNLSDLTNIATARTNLGLGTLATANSIDLGSASATGVIAEARLATQANVTSGTQYTKVTVDGKGRVTSGAQLSSSDVTAALGYTPASSGSTVSSQWTTNGSNIYYNTGNVGVGIAAPTEKLHVNGKILANNGSSLYIDSNASATILANTANIPMTFQTNSSERMRIDGSGNVGIGTSSPSAQLHLSKAGNNYLQIDDTANSSNVRLFSSGNTSYIGTVSAHKFNIRGGGIDAITVDSTGNVGIGTSAPAATVKLDVAGSLRVKSDIVNHDDSDFRSALSLTHSGTGTGYGNGSTVVQVFDNMEIVNFENGYLMFKTQDIERMRITATGEVGVGISVPTAKLHLTSGTTSIAPLRFTSSPLLTTAVSGAIEYDGSNLYFTDGTNTRRTIAATTGAGTYDSASVISNSSGNIAMYPNGGAGSVVVSATTASTSSNTGALVVQGGLGVAGTTNIGGGLNVSGSSIIDGVLKLSSMTSGSVLFAGANGAVSQDNSNFYWDGANKRLGIGSNSPAQNLSVSGSGYLSGAVGIGTTPTLAKLTVGNGESRFWVSSYADPDSGNSYDAKFGGNGRGIAVRGQSYFAGNVGVGTSSPSGTLDLSAAGDPNLYLTRPGLGAAYGAAGVGKIIFRDGDNAKNVAEIQAVGYSPGTTGDLTFRTINGGSVTEKVRITSAGNVGIGTSSPGAKLEVNDGSNTSLQIIPSGGVAELRTINKSGGYYSARYDAIQHIWNVAGTEKARIDTAGNYGIGTANPGALLQVGENTVSSSAFRFTPSGDQSSMRFTTNSAANWIQSGVDFTTDSKKDLRFSSINGASTWMNIQGSTGNVGIGTTSPDGILHVSKDTGSGSYGNYPMLTVDNPNATGYAAINLNKGAGIPGLIGRFYKDPSNNVILGSYASSPLIFETGASEKMRILPNGNVGIGTTTPAAKLDVVGGMSIDGLKIKDLGDSGSAGRWFKVGRIQNTNPIDSSETAYLSGQLFVQDDFGNTASLQSVVTFGFGVRGGSLAPILFNAGSTATRIDSDKWAFQVWKDSSNWHYLYFFQPEYSRYAKFIYQANAVTESWVSEDPTTVGGATKIWDSRTDAAQPSEFYGGLNALRGKVGIGTTSPSYSFQVQKTSSAPAMMIGGGNAGSPRLQVYGLDADSNAWMGLGTDMGGNVYEHSVYFPTGPTNNGRLTIGDFNGTTYTTRMTVLQNGNVGIGTTTPIEALDIGQNKSIFLEGNSNSWGYKINVNDYGGGDVPMRFIRRNAGTDSEMMRITQTGRVGIGTTAPQELLHVEAPTSGRMQVGTGNILSTSGYGVSLESDTDDGVAYINTHTQAAGANSSALIIRGGHGAAETAATRNIASFRTDSGNVGIGYSAPTSKLQVNGGIKQPNHGQLIVMWDGTTRTVTMPAFLTSAYMEDHQDETFTWRGISPRLKDTVGCAAGPHPNYFFDGYDTTWNGTYRMTLGKLNATGYMAEIEWHGWGTNLRDAANAVVATSSNQGTVQATLYWNGTVWQVEHMQGQVGATPFSCH